LTSGRCVATVLFAHEKQQKGKTVCGVRRIEGNEDRPVQHNGARLGLAVMVQNEPFDIFVSFENN